MLTYKKILSSFCFFFIANAAFCGYSVSPVIISNKAQPTERYLNFYLTNTSKALTSYQFTISSWHQKGNKSTLTPATDLHPSPPVTPYPVPYNQTQVVRIAGPKNTTQQVKSYRLTVQELPFNPAPFKPVPKQETKTGVDFLISMSLPVFIYPTDWHRLPKIALRSKNWKLTSPKKNQYVLTLHNTKKEPIVLDNLTLSNKKETKAYEDKYRTYVLPGVTHHWTFKSSVRPTVITAQYDKKEHRFEL